jgi:ATP adenylyltransferase
MRSGCNLCRKFHDRSGEREVFDHVLFESPNFVVVPTVGSIVPGWLLVIPREHFLCIGAMNEALCYELEDLRKVAAEALRECYGPVTCFEHGPAVPATSVGCGVDHAQLHLVATQIDLLEGARRLSKNQIEWERADGLETTMGFHLRKLPYLFVHHPSGEAWMATHPRIESQLLRKVIATESGVGALFDWKSHRFESNVRDTIAQVENWKRCALVETVEPTGQHG